VLSGRVLCDELITRPEESYRLCCVVVCYLETSGTGAPYIYDISSLRVKNDLRIVLRIFEHTQDPCASDLKVDMGKRNLCARFVAHYLTPEQNKDRVTLCLGIIVLADADKIFFIKVIVGKVTWCIL